MEAFRVGTRVKSINKSQDSATGTYDADADADAECLVASIHWNMLLGTSVSHLN